MLTSTDLHLYSDREKILPELCSSLNIWKPEEKRLAFISSEPIKIAWARAVVWRGKTNTCGKYVLRIFFYHSLALPSFQYLTYITHPRTKIHNKR